MRYSRTDSEKLNQFKDEMLSDMKNLIKRELSMLPVPVKKSATTNIHEEFKLVESDV